MRAPLVWPAVDVVVPVHDEAAHIVGKIANLQNLEYPGPIAFWIVDGQSRDQTRALASEAAAGDERFSILDAATADKTAQLNYGFAASAAGFAASAAAFPSCRSEWVLVTDA